MRLSITTLRPYDDPLESRLIVAPYDVDLPVWYQRFGAVLAVERLVVGGLYIDGMGS